MRRFLGILTAISIATSAFVACDGSDDKDQKATLTVDKTELAIPGAGCDTVINVSSNSYWDVSITDSDGLMTTWITASPTSGRENSAVSLTIAQNPETTERTAIVTISTASGEGSAEIRITQEGSSVIVPPTPSGYSFPVCEMLQIDDNHNLSNATISGNTCTFTDGLKISRSGEDASMAFLCPAHTSPKDNPWFQRAVTAANWAAGDYWLVTIPMKSELYGDLRFYFGSRKDGITSAGGWTFEWSKDGTNWNAFQGAITASASDAMWKYIDFSIPESGKIEAGGTLYIKFTITAASTSILYFSHGICITKSSAEQSSLEAMNSTDVVFSNGFDDILSANASYIELPIGFMRSWTTGYGASGYAVPDGYSKYETVSYCFGRPGYLQVGYADESLFSRDKIGSFTINIGERLKEMGYTKADLSLTFKGASITDAYGNKSHANLTVSADGTSGATVTNGEIGDNLEACVFKTFTVTIKNATQATTLTFSTPETEGLEAYQKDYRFFLDDIVVKISGNAEKNGNEGNGGIGGYGEGNDWK
jgi:hypothetical protein